MKLNDKPETIYRRTFFFNDVRYTFYDFINDKEKHIYGWYPQKEKRAEYPVFEGENIRTYIESESEKVPVFNNIDEIEKVLNVKHS